MYNNNLEALQLQVNSMSAILEHIEACFYIKDLDYKYVYVNKHVEAIFQTSSENIIGKDDSYFFDFQLSDELRRNDTLVIKQKKTLESTENNVIKSSGEKRIYKIIKKPIFNDANEVIGLCGYSTDITEQKNLERQSHDQKHLLDTILDNVDAYIYMKDSTRKFRYVNSKVAQLFGHPVDDIVGKRDSEVIPQEFADHFWQSDKRVFSEDAKQIINEEIADNDGNIRHYISVKVPYQFSDNSRALIGFSSDVTELYELKERFKLQANTDYLTAIFNRRYFFKKANAVFKHAQQHGHSLAVIALDIDHFKLINDEYGHLVGDDVLVKLTQLIQANCLPEYIFARTGGEEFTILLPNSTAEQTIAVAEKLRRLFDGNPIMINDMRLAINISLGVSVIQPHDKLFQELYARSDKALYQAKDQGRNKVQMII